MAAAVARDIIVSTIIVIAMNDGAGSHNVSAFQAENLGNVNCAVIALWQCDGGHPRRLIVCSTAAAAVVVINFGCIKQDSVQVQRWRLVWVSVANLSDGMESWAS